MPQLNVLPISVSQSVDVMDESAAFTGTKYSEDFSQLIDQHLANSPVNKGTNKTDTSKLTDNSEAEKLAQQTTKQLDKASDDSVNENKSIERQGLETAQQEVATSGKNGQDAAASLANSSEEQALSAPEQLMSFLHKADNTLVAQPEQLTTQLEKKLEHLSAEQKALYEAQLLLNGRNLVADLSGVAKALSTEQLEQELAQNITDKNYLLSASDASSMIGKGTANQAVKAVIEGNQQMASVTDITEPKIKAESADLLTKKQINIAEQNQKVVDVNLVSSAIKTDKNVESLVQNQFKQEVVAKPKANNKDFIEANQGSKTNGAAENIVKQASKINGVAEGVLKQEQVFIADNDVAKTQGSHSEKPVADAASQFKSTQSALNEKIAELAQVKQAQQGQSEASISSQLKQGNTNQVNLNNNVKNSTDINNELSDINVELSGKLEESKVITSSQVGVNQGAINQVTANQSVEQHNIQKSAEHRVNLGTQTMNVANDLIEQQFSMAQGQKSEQEYLSSKVLSQVSEEVVVEDKSIKAVKAELSANASFSDVSAKATQVAQHIFEQQSADILNPAVSTEVTQSQKTNAQLHQETIAIFRKDFADAVKDKVMLMISQKLQQFDINLDPPELGNMQVRVNLQNEQAAVSFIVQNQQAKEALEQNMHKLRDMLAQQGVDVGDANVEQQSQQSDNESNFEGSDFQEGQETAQADDIVEHALSAKMINSSVNAVDYYA